MNSSMTGTGGACTRMHVLHAEDCDRTPPLGRAADPVLLRRFSVAARLLASGVILLGLFVLAGWWLDIPAVRSVVPGFSSMKANAAAGLILSGLALLLLGTGRRLLQGPARLLGAFVSLLGTVTLSQDLFGWDLGIDQLLVDIKGFAGERSGRMAPTAALGFALCGFSLAIGTRSGERRRQYGPSITALLSLLALYGYIFDAQSLYGIGTYSSMAVPTALGLLMLALGILFVMPHRGWMAVLTSSGVDGILARRLLPAALAIPVLLAVIERIGEASGWYDRPFGEAMFCMLLTAGLAVGIWRTGRVLAAEEQRRMEGEQDLRKMSEVAGQAAAEARDSEARYRSVVAALSEGVVVFAPDGSVRTCNPAAERILRLSGDGMMNRAGGLSAWRPVREDGTPFPIAELPVARTLVSGQGQRGIVLGDTQPDGSVAWLLVNSEAVRDPASGAVTAAVVSFTDVTARNRAEAELRASEARFRATFEQAAVGIALVDLNGSWLRVNQRLCSITGYARDELMQCTFQDITHPEDLAADLAHVKRLLAGETDHYEMEKRYYRKDGSIVWANLTVALARRPDGTADYFVSVVEDVSERKAMQQALQESTQQLAQFNSELARQVAQRTRELEDKARALKAAKDEADRANQAKSDFLANISHEIRTPMNAILGTAQILERCELNGEQRHLVHTIRSAGRGLLTIINDVLDLAKIEAGRFELEQASFVLRNVLSNLRDVLFASAVDKGLDFVVAPLPAEIDALVGDAQRLGQVLFNLTGNAIKFTPRGKVTVSVQLVARHADQVTLRFAVCDTGIGIVPDQIDRLFEAFAQADTGRRYGGTGLGLAISRQLVTLMGGEIGVRSRQGEGSEFWFVVPFAVAPSQPAATDAATGARPGARLKGLRVLVVDDSPVNQEVACRLLTLEGAVSEVADNGHIALERLRAGHEDFDLVLMDVQMPVLDGLEAARRIRAEAAFAGLPVIALTAGALPSQRERAFAAGMNDFIAKPFELDAMVATILRRAGDRLPRATASRAAPSAALMPPRANDDGFPPVPGIDIRRAAQRLLGNKSLFLSSLRHLCEEFADAAAQTRTDLALSNTASAEARMHKLRGVAGNLSADTIAKLAGMLEDALRAGQRDGFDETLAQLEVALGELVAGLPQQPDATAAAGRDTAAISAEQAGLARAEVERLIVELAAQDVGAIRRFRAIQEKLAAIHGAAVVASLAEMIEILHFVEAKEQLRIWYPGP